MNTLFNHLVGEDLITLLLSELIKFLLVTALQEQHIVEAGLGNTRPADDFLPVGKVSTVRKGRPWEVLIHLLAQLLRGQVLED